MIPSGILHPGKVCVIGNGVVVDPAALLTEIDGLEASGITVAGRLLVSDRCHVIFPFHRMLDECRERRRRPDEKIGTTKRGIGPAYGDKVSRVGLRMGDLVSPDFPDRLARRMEEANLMLAAMGADPVPLSELQETYLAIAERLSAYVVDTIPVVAKSLAEKQEILLEGAQGTMLDIDFGTYPFVTSSNATAGGACIGTGVSPKHINRVIGVIKAYTTRVGEGPFPTELTDEIGERLGREGHEFGATTGRPRRCGWFDAVIGRYSALINGVDFWAMTKVDVLDSIETLKICTAYECDGERYDTIPADIHVLSRCKPVYEEMPGWCTSTKGVRRYEDLPPAAQAYVERLCELTGVPLGILSVGPGRDSTLRIAI